MSDQHAIPNEILLQVVAEQRNTFLDEAARMKALAISLKDERDQLKADNDRLIAENEKLRADQDATS